MGFYGQKSNTFEVSKTHDIHDDLDFEICKILLKKNKIFLCLILLVLKI